MALSFVTALSATTNNGTSVAVTVASVTVGDALTAVVGQRSGSGGEISAPAGWTLRGIQRNSGTNLGSALFTKIAEAGDTSGTWTFSLTGANTKISAVVLVFTPDVGVDVEYLDSLGQVNASAVNIAVPAVTIPGGKTVVLRIASASKAHSDDHNQITDWILPTGGSIATGGGGVTSRNRTSLQYRLAHNNGDAVTVTSTTAADSAGFQVLWAEVNEPATGTSASVAPAATAAAGGTSTVTGSAAGSAPDAVAAASGTSTVTGTTAVTSPAVTSTAAGTVGGGAATLTIELVEGSTVRATWEREPGAIATETLTLTEAERDSITNWHDLRLRLTQATTQVDVIDLVGEQVAAGVEGTVAATAPAVSSSAAGTSTVVGTSATTAPAVTSAASGTSTVVGTATATTPAVTSAAVGAPAVTGTVATSTPAVTASATDDGAITGTVAAVAPAVTSAAAGRPESTGTATAQAPAVTAAATGTSTVTGTAATTTAAVTTTAAGSPVIAGSVTTTAPAVVTAATDGGAVAGTVATTTPAAQGSAAGSPVVAGTVTSTAPSVTSSAAGATTVTGTASATTPSATGAVVGAPEVSGTGTATAPVVSVVIFGTPEITGTVGAVAPAVTSLSLEVPPPSYAYIRVARASRTGPSVTGTRTGPSVGARRTGPSVTGRGPKP